VPDPEQQEVSNGALPKNSGEVIKTDPTATEPELPPVSPPSTKTPVQFNQQVNVYQQIPPSAWDRLSSDQIVELSRIIVKQIDIADRRQFEYAIEQAKADCSGKKMALACGAAIALGGFGGAIYLGMHGHEFIALSITLPLATILAVIVGNRFLE
jgi:hypothetical protein